MNKYNKKLRTLTKLLPRTERKVSGILSVNINNMENPAKRQIANFFRNLTKNSPLFTRLTVLNCFFPI